MKIRCLISLFVVVGLASCSTTDDVAANVEENLSVETTGLEFEISPPSSNFYRILEPCYRNGALSKLVGYNEANHSIDVYSLPLEEGRWGTNIYKLEHEGPLGLPEVNFVSAISEDSILVVANNKLVVLDSRGKEIYRHDIKIPISLAQTISSTADFHAFLSEENGRVGYFDAANKLFTFPIRNAAAEEFFSSDYYNSIDPLVAQFDLKNKTFRFIPIHFPEYLTKGIYGILGRSFITPVKDKVYYGFAAKPDIYVYDVVSGETTSLAPDLDYPAPEPLIDIVDVEGNTKNANYFLNINIDPISGVLVRHFNQVKTPGERGRLVYHFTYDSNRQYRGYKNINGPVAFFGIVQAGGGYYATNMLGTEAKYKMDFISY